MITITRLAGRAKSWLGWSILLLVVLMGQIALIAQRGGGNPPAGRGLTHAASLAVWDTVRGFPVQSATGVEKDFLFARGDGRWTTVLAFKSTCVHCRTVAGAWREWLAREHSADILLLANEPYSSAAAFAEEHGWTRPVSVVSAATYPEARVLVSRTPWVFLVSPTGVLVYHSHGANISALDSVMVANQSSMLFPRNREAIR
jgi:hypothetical protein